ncbi:MAG: glycosyltransferase family 2 protein [Candidatus Shapirobacteria bacterium]|nr:glycosyltransferase family 2 protein [Candidatus Shapirobacteria bacterium]
MTKIDFIIPTLNCAAQLELCLESISSQTYKNYDIYIIDGGSTDKTIAVAKKYNCLILKNPLKTAEAGKAVGIKNSHSPFLAFVDSDNILPSSNWLIQILLPFSQNKNIVGSEPWAYTYRPHGGFIERYSSLTGVNDPYTLIAGNYDRINYLFPGWTNLNIDIKDFPTYQIAKFNPHRLFPTIGANGTIFKRSVFKNFKSDYFFDIDILTTLKNPIYFAKVKVGIIHSFCESSISKFYRKQIRRATDLYIYRNLRNYSLTQNNLIPTLKFILYVLLVIPMLYDMFRGFIKKPDPAWFIHPILCIITLYCYGLTTIKNFFKLLKPVNRNQWQQ